MKSRLLFLAVCLTVAATLGAEVTRPGVRKAQVPRRFIKIDALDVGEFVPFGDWGAISVHPLSVTCVIDRVRFGLSAVDSYMAIDFWSSNIMLPVHIGYTILSNPQSTWRLWGTVPDVHVDAIGSLWRCDGNDLEPEYWRFCPTVEVAACCDVDYYGLGAGLRVGAYRSAAIRYGQEQGILRRTPPASSCLQHRVLER